MPPVSGIHHVTAIASDPQRNIDFYAGILGLRLVKRTVNFDDPETYHLYYGDGVGTPGSILTFFPWPRARRGRQGVGQAAITSFAITTPAVAFWLDRFVRHGVAFERPTKRSLQGNPQSVIAFRDHDGLMLELVASDAAASRAAWTGATGIPGEHAIRGFQAVTLWEDQGAVTERLLIDTLGFRELTQENGVRTYAAGDGGPGTQVSIRSAGGFLRGVSGAGTVHHVAWRVADDAAQVELRQEVIDHGFDPTPVIDRQYFHSVYFREPGGILFELATDPPGFAIDEPVDRLGERLMLPPQYEPLRANIEAALPPIHLAMSNAAAAMLAGQGGEGGGGPEDVSGDALGFVHRYIPPSAEGELAASVTLLLLHGTGGDEDDLVPLGRALLPGAGLLSPRGKVLERGMPRFFRRLAEGVFDQEDLARRTEELAQFVEGAAASYSLVPNRIVAVGFSNGANIAASLLLRHPGLVRGAILLRPMVPFEPNETVALAGTSVFIGAGRTDTMSSASQTERLGRLFSDGGADVTIHWVTGGHEITPADVEAARQWLTKWAGAGDAVGAREAGSRALWTARQQSHPERGETESR